MRRTSGQRHRASCTTYRPGDCESIAKHDIVNYYSAAYRVILVTENGSVTRRYAYAASGTRVSAEFRCADSENQRFAQNDLEE